MTPISILIAALSVVALLATIAAVRYYRMSLEFAGYLDDAAKLIDEGVTIIEAMEKDFKKVSAHNQHLMGSVSRSIETGSEYAAAIVNYEREKAALQAENLKLRTALGAQREIIKLMSPYQALPTRQPWGKN